MILTPVAAMAKGITTGPLVFTDGWFVSPWFDPWFDSFDDTILIPGPSSAIGETPQPTIVFGSLTFTPQISSGPGITGGPGVICGSLCLLPAAGPALVTTFGPHVVIAGNSPITLSIATGVGKTKGPSVMPSQNSSDTRSLESISNTAGLSLGADSAGDHKFTGALDMVRIMKDLGISPGEARGHRDIIHGTLNGSTYPEVGHALGQYWAFYRLAQYYFISNDPGAREILNNWLNWLDAHGKPDGSGWQFPTGFSEYGFTYGDYDPGAAASLALGCLYTYLRGGQPSAATWARRILDDLRSNRQGQEYGGGYKSDYHYAWLNALVIQTFGVAAHGLTGQAYHFPSLPEDAAHFDALMDWLFQHAGDAKPNLLNADLIPFTYLEATDVWDYAPHYVFTEKLGSVEALVLMLGVALAFGKGTGDWVWFERLWRFVLEDNLVKLNPSQVKALTAAYQLAGVKNVVRVFYADYDQDNSRFWEARDHGAVAAWGEAVVDMDLRYDAPVVLEDPELAQLLATRLLKRLSSPWEVVNLETWLEGARLEIGDTLAVTSPFHGFEQDEFTVFGKGIDLKNRRCSLNLARPFNNPWAWAVDAAGSDFDSFAIDQENKLDSNWADRAYAG